MFPVTIELFAEEHEMFTIRSKKFQQHLITKPRGVSLNFPRLLKKNGSWESSKASKLVDTRKK
jgi:hypothetical protein